MAQGDYDSIYSNLPRPKLKGRVAATPDPGQVLTPAVQAARPQQSAQPGPDPSYADQLAQWLYAKGTAHLPASAEPALRNTLQAGADLYNQWTPTGSFEGGIRSGMQGDAAGYVTGVLGAAPIPGAPAGKIAAKGAEEAVEGAAGTAAKSKLFDYSNLSKVPDVPQFDLPRYAPPRGVPARVTDLTANPDVRQGMLDTIQRGVDMGGADWYNAEPLRQHFISELGDAEGNQRFQQYMDMVAATSPRSDVGTNVRNASYYYNRLVNDQGMPAVGEANPQPYGHMAQRLHQQNAQTVAGGGWDPLQNPKPASFAQDLVGNQQPVAVDTHAFRLPGMLAQDPRFLETAYQSSKDAPKQNIQQLVTSGQMSMEDALKQPAYWQAQPKANEYGAMEQYYQQLAQDQGLSPAQGQAAAWVGGGQTTGLASDASKPFIGFVEDRANKTADVRGLSPAEALSQFIRGNKPLLGVGAGAAAMPPLWQQFQQYQDPQNQQPWSGYGQPSA